MKIGINASFLRKQNTGLGQVTVNFLKKLAEISTLDPTLKDRGSNHEFVLYLEEDVDITFLDAAVFPVVKFHKKIFLPRWKRDDLIRKIWWEKIMLPKKVKEDACDVFISLYQCPTTLCCNRKIKHIMIVHDIIPKLFPQYLNNIRKKLYHWLIQHAIRRADRIIAISHRTEKDLIQYLGVDPAKITVSYLDVDDIYKENVSDEESARVLKKYSLTPGYIYNGGGLEVRKNGESVLRAYKILLEAYGHASWLPRMVISGKMMPQLAPLVTDVAQIVEGLDISRETSLLDFVSQEDLPALYKNAALFVFPSFYEGFGLPVLEAMNQGVPVITAKTSSLPEVGSDAVLYCDPKDVDELARIMKKILTDDHLRSALSLKGKERAKHFSMSKFVAKVMHITQEIKKDANSAKNS